MVGNSSGGWADAFFGAAGDDTLVGLTGGDYLVGGSGDDSVEGGDDNDSIWGDYSDTHVIVEVDSFNYWRNPSEADPSVVGNDMLDGGDGADTLYGGPGSDQLYGGPRGAGNTDVLTGGDDADAFYLTYTSQSSGGGTSFWAGFAEEYVAGIGGDGVSAGVSALGGAVAKDFFETVAGSVLLGGMSTALGDLAGAGISLLFGMNKSPTPQPTGEDVIVITDFDPREDVLFLPLDTGGGSGSDAMTLEAIPANFGSAATNNPYTPTGNNPNSATGESGWGIQFTKGTSNTIFAEVFLDPDFLADFGIKPGTSSEVSYDFIHDIFNLAVVIDENGVQQSENVYPFPTDPAAYTDGVVPSVADTPVDFKAPSDTLTRVYGAFGPQIFVAPTTTLTTVFVAGTNMGDIAFITVDGFAPDDWDNAAVVAQVSNASFIQGYGGDDILNGSMGEDSIFGGDGDDFIYGWNAASAPNRDQLYGNGGDDTLFAAKPLGGRAAADFDGDDTVSGNVGNDTVSFTFSRVAVTASLATGTGTNAGDDASAGPAYTFVNVENLTGTDYDDSLTGDENDNILQGNADTDTLDGGGGNDTAAYTDNVGKVAASLPDGTASEYGADGSSDAGTIQSTDLLSGIENLTGSAFDDTLTGDDDDNILQGNAGSDWLAGGGGNDTASYADNSGKVTVDLKAGTASEFGPNGGSSAGTIVSTDSLSGIENVVGSAYADVIAGTDDGAEALSGAAGNDSLSGGGTNDTLDGGSGDDTLDGGDGDDAATYAEDLGKVAVDLAAGTAQQYGEDGTDAADTVAFKDALFGIEIVVGSDYDDTLLASDDGEDFNGGAGDDTVYGGAGNDILDGGDDDDVVRGDDGDDSLIGDDGNDLLNAGDGADTVDGGDDNDTVYGGLGADTITGGDGDDSLVGGTDGVLYRVNAGGDAVLAPDGSLDWSEDTAADKSPYLVTSGNIFDTAAPIDYVPAAVNDQPIDLFDQERWYSSHMTWEFPVETDGNYEVRLYLVEGVEEPNPNTPPPTRIFNVEIEGTATGDFVDINPFVQGGQNNGGLGRQPYVLANTGKVTDGTLTLTFVPQVQYPKINAIEIVSLTPSDASGNAIGGGDGNDTILGDKGNDTLSGDAGNDTITGGAGDDIFVLAEGDETDTITDFEIGIDLIGLAGDLTFDDLVLSGSSIRYGSVTLATLENVDTANLTQNDFVPLDPDVAPDPITDGGGGTAGDDSIFGSDAADTLAGLSGNDTLNGNGGDDEIDGGFGDDVIRGDDGDDWIVGGSGDDTATGGDGRDELRGGSGHDVLAGAGGNDTINAGAGHDGVNGGSGHDAIDGGGGNDTLNGNTGRDTLDGGANGDDSLAGGDSADLISGRTGQDVLDGGRGQDTLQGGRGDDSIAGGSGDDLVRGGQGADDLSGDEGDDLMTGLAGGDGIHGGRGDDTLAGGDGDDVLEGEAGDDLLRGEAGDDFLRGGSGADRMSGGTGEDIFAIAVGPGGDIIVDFELGADRIGLEGGLRFGDLSFDGAHISVDGEIIATLRGVDTSSLSYLDFVLV
ncbi:malectin domain-containing carbohydrate-binding protein [Acuticoccus kandeliae]|uniref:malectin domain-containing carbohydrate-binding protein n=1 Tax=Acuticoccus kandeliae TaxID=2073160 RepID=UPI0014743D33|nr:malectin domain-containing carbohydrate-binding protein [Acuticoccus kandeliae]